MAEYIVISTPFVVKKPEVVIAWIGLKAEDIDSYEVCPEDSTQVWVKVAAGKHPEYVKHIPLLVIEELADEEECGGCGSCGCEENEEPGPAGQACS